ncbi:hypothetical protein C8R45DRAFT_1093195 [Mycena sanguinolenta]|nr:hypothetical protein C8R45DRAFT_1093195 [Mycena sanguinolenta]
MPTPQQPKRKVSAESPCSPSPEYDQADAEREKILCVRSVSLSEYQRELTALEAKRLKMEKKPRVKDDPDIVADLTQDSKKKVKKESKPAFTQGEIIDLT